MNLLRDIQASLLKEDSNLAPILLKLRLLAARLGSEPLEDWIKHESEGYPTNEVLPDYRKLDIAYVGHFSGPFGSGIQHAPIPLALIRKFAGEHWTTYSLRQSVAAIDDLVNSDREGSGSLQVNCADLILLLQGKVYEDYACNSIAGTISRASLVEIQHVVRSRILELTIKLEKSVPNSLDIDLHVTPASDLVSSEIVTQVFHQVVQGNVTTINNSGDNSYTNLIVNERDRDSLVSELVRAGIESNDAEEFARILVAENPESSEQPLGTKAQSWLVNNLKKAANGTWKIGTSVASEVITQAALKFYGLDQ